MDAQPREHGRGGAAATTTAAGPARPAGGFPHRELLGGDFWRALPAYADVDEATFLDPAWQAHNAVTTPERLGRVVGGRLPAEAYEDLADGLRRAPMSVRLTPYVLALVDWDRFEDDPLRRQFLPLGSGLAADHPRLGLDSLCEREYSPVPGITHRHADAVLFLTLDTCPVYCRFCTRSYLVGSSTERLEKGSMKVDRARWGVGLDYVRSHPEVEDVVLSGGDTYLLAPEQIRGLVGALLDVPNVRRVRMATRGPAVLPMKLLRDDDWVGAVVGVSAEARRRHKSFHLHTHFNHPRELTEITAAGLNRLHESGVTLRNQCVLLSGVNDDAETMRLLVKRLGHVNVQSYYVYQQDMVPGVEDLRTPLRRSIALEKDVRGVTAGFHVPLFIVDLPGGGGKRDVHSHELYDPVTGVSLFRSPLMSSDRVYTYFDPIHTLPDEGRARWADPGQHEAMVAEALEELRSRPVI